MNPKKVVHIIQAHVDFQKEGGGVANVVRALALGGRTHGIQSVIYCGNWELDERKGEPGSRKIDDWISRVVLDQTRNPLWGPTSELIRRLELEEGPYVAHIHSCFSAMTEAAMAYFTKKGIPFIFTPHGKLSPGLFRKKSLFKRLWFDLFVKDPVNQAGRVVLCSRGEARLFGRLGIKDGYETIPNGYNPVTLRERNGKPGKTILFLGFLHPRKQPALLVRAYAHSKAREHFTLTLAGPDVDGQLSRVRSEVKKAGLQDRVFLPGPVYGETKQELFQAAACFALPSKAEGMPVALLEALGAGLPLVISAECNFPEAAQAGAALQLDGFSPAQWAKALDEVLLDETLNEEMAKAALRLGREYVWPRVIERWATLYGEMLAEKPELAGVPA